MAREGVVFSLRSIPRECRTCRLYRVCVGVLRPGVRYRVVEVRQPTMQTCPLTEDEVVPVVVEAVPERTYVPPMKALEGAVVTIGKLDCGGCEPCAELGKARIVRVLGERCGDRVMVEAVPLG